MSKAVRKTIRDVAIITLIGFAYYLFYRITGLGIPCTFRTFTGLRCPSCGITHMIVDLTKLDFKGAFEENQFLFFTWPLVAVEIVYIIYTCIESDGDLPKWNVALIIAFGILLFAFGVLRIIFNW